MSESFAAGRAVARPGASTPGVSEPRAGERGGLAELDLRRTLQLALAVIWLLDGVLQYQPSMFTSDFPRMLAGTSSGNPAVVASPITWSATFIDHHLVAVNAIFATIQLALGLGIAWRPTARLALGASVAWSLGVWWFGEGFGSVLTGTASPVNGAPGAVILYALLAVLLWPADRDPAAPFVAGRAVGRGVARGLWLVLWASLAFFALQPASRAPRAIGGMISDMAAGQPGWLAWIDQPRRERPGPSGPGRLDRARGRAGRRSPRPLPAGPAGAGGGRPGHRPGRRSSGSPKAWAACSPAAAPTRTRARCSPCWRWRSGPPHRNPRRRRKERDMGGPAWLAGIFAAVMIAVAAYCASRLVVARWRRRPTDVDSDGAHVVMGVAMAGMLVTGLRFGPAGAWEAVFAAAAGWFGWRLIRVRRGAPVSQWRCPQPVPHLVECGAMLYMYLAVPAVAVAAKGAPGGMGGMPATGSRFSFLALVLALFLLGYVAWVADRLAVRTPAVAVAVLAAPSRPRAGRVNQAR